MLRGPQSTLFGKNTIGGALNITSAKPTEDFEAELSAMYEVEHEEVETKGYISGALSDSVRGRFAFLTRDIDDGWMENTYYDQNEPQTDEWAARGSIEWDVSEDLMISVKYEHGDWDNSGSSFDQEILTPVLGGILGAAGADVVAGNGKTTIGNNTPGIDYGASQTFEGDVDEFAVRADYSLSNGTITAILGHSEYAFDRNLDADFNALDGIGFEEEEDYDQDSLEVRFVSEFGDGFEMIAGVYYQQSEFNFLGRSNFNLNLADADSFGPIAVGSIIGESMIPGSPLVPILDADSSGTVDAAEASALPNAIGQFTRLNTIEQESESWAAFAQGTWDVSDVVRVTVGLRYGEEDKSAEQGAHCANGWDSSTPNDTAPNCNAFSLLLAEFVPHQFNDLQRDEENWTYTVNTQWDVTADIMAYATMSTGVKSGGFNSFALSADADEAEFEQEEVKSFELGAKMSLLDGAAELNVAVFDMEYDDLQSTIFTGATGFKVENAASASIQGLELDGRWQLAESLMLRGSVGYVDFEYDEYDVAGCTAAQRADLGFLGLFTKPAPGATSGTATAVGTNAFGQAATCEQDLAGGTSAYTPEYTANISIEHEVTVGDNLYLRTVVDANYQDEHHTAQDNDELVKQDAFTTVNLAMTLGSQDDRWDVALIARNLTDEQYITYSNDMPLFAGSQQVGWGREASYGIRGRIKF